jgi:hypothetical protein
VPTGLIAEPFAAQGNRLQGALRVGFIGQLDLKTLFAVACSCAQALQLFLRLGVAFFNLRRDIHLLMQTLLGFLNA